MTNYAHYFVLNTDCAQMTFRFTFVYSSNLTISGKKRKQKNTKQSAIEKINCRFCSEKLCHIRKVHMQIVSIKSVLFILSLSIFCSNSRIAMRCAARHKHTITPTLHLNWKAERTMLMRKMTAAPTQRQNQRDTKTPTVWKSHIPHTYLTQQSKDTIHWKRMHFPIEIENG